MKDVKVLLAVVLMFLAAPVRSVETAFWQVGTFDEFLAGTLSGVTVSKEGELRLAPEASAVFSPEEALALSLAGESEGNVYVGTGHQGKVFKLGKDLKGSLFFTAHESDVFAMAVGPDGALYVGTSPEGKIYRVTPDGKSKVFYDPKAIYIWALVFDSQGRLYAGTGDQGKVLRIDPTGKGEVFFESKQTHVMCLALDRQGNLLAGSAPNGLIYKVSSQGKAFVLYQATLPEIHELATDSEGRIFAAALGGSGGRGGQELYVTPAPGGPAVKGPPSVTVTGSEEARAASVPAQNPQVAPSSPPSFNRPGPSNVGFGMPAGTQGRGSVIEILPDSTAETLWSSNNESTFGLAVRKNHILFATDSNGRIFDMDPSLDGQKLTLLTETHESLATRLLLQGSDLFVATSNVARIFRVSAGPAREGSFESAVKDSKLVSQWGVLAWRGETSPGTSLEFFSRSGNSDRPDATWSDWAGPYSAPEGSRILSPPARYFQWKALFRGTGNHTPVLDEVTISFLNHNLSPQIRSLNVTTGGERTNAGYPPAGPPPSSGGAATVSLVPSSGFGNPPSSGGIAKTPTIITWQADDPNGDQLVYSLYIKATDEQEWHLLKDRLRQTSFQIEPNALADGKYVARLVASDEDSNPPDQARRAEMLSAPFWIDNTPPLVQVMRQTVIAGGCEVQFQVEDSTSPLRAAEVALDDKEWRNAVSDDGVVDSRKETFTVKIPRLEPGEHVVSLRAYDTAGNVGVGKAIVRVQAPRESGR